MEQKDKNCKYVCEKCNFKCNAESAWNIHCNTEKHKTGKKKTRSDCVGPYTCDKCDFTSIYKVNYLQHKLKYHATKEEREKEFKFYCKICDVGTFSEKQYDKHMSGPKHKKMVEYNK